jgi:hypothetical protein
MPPTPRVRPRFELTTPLALGAVVSRVRARLSEDVAVDGLVLEDRVELVSESSAKHLWSPQLTVDLTETAEGTRLLGRFGPHPHVWTLYVLIHAVGAFTTIGAAMFGISQYIAGLSPWALWALPASPLLAALVWALAFVGQGLGAEEMYRLRRFLERALDDSDPTGDEP